MNYDVVIIGAGPAGISAAHNLINNDISCCVIDKQKFPRDKLCAGGITSKTFDIIKSLDLKDEFNGKNTVVSENVSLYLEYEYITDIKCKEKTYLVDRLEFDEYLVKEYEKKDGVILENTKVKNIDTKNNLITLDDNNKLKFKYVIGADGAVGITHSIVEKDFKVNGFCLQIDVNKDECKYYSDNMSMYYGVLPYGYGWIFPKQNHISVGFIGNYDKSIDYTSEFNKFLSKLKINYKKSEYKGAFIPFGNYIKSPINKDGNLILVGDAAGFVDPITGEGIYFAVQSGIKASDIIIKSIQNKNSEYIKEYNKEILEITKNIRLANHFKKLIYTCKVPIFKSMKNDKIGGFLFNDCLYKSNYNLLKSLKH